jgi:hypothetical protein
VIDFEATLLKVRSMTPPIEDESDELYAVRTLHLTYLLVEHSPQDAVLLPEEKEDNENAK